MLNIIIVVITIVVLTAIVVSEEKYNIPADGMGYIARYPNTGEHEVIKLSVQVTDKIKNMNIYADKDLLSKLINEAAGQKIDEAFVGRDFDPEEFNRHAVGVIIDNAVPSNDPDVGTVVANHVKSRSMTMRKIMFEEAGKRIDEKFYMVNGLKNPVDLPIDFIFPILKENEIYMKEVPEF